MNVAVVRADARALPLPDGCVDLVVTSPPYFGLRSYTDGGEHYPGQIGSEPTPQEWLTNLWACTAEWVRVLKPEGSLFINLGDKYDSGTTSTRVNPGTVKDGQGQGWHQGTPRVSLGQPKSLLGLPWRYALGCVDRLGLILRAEIIWAKPNGLPESVTDRVRRAHEQVFHFTRQPRYYAAVDEIREPHLATAGWNRLPRSNGGMSTIDAQRTHMGENPLGKLPGSVWEIPSQPLTVPPALGVDHFAAFPMELPRRVIAGWSPPGVCTACGQGRRPVSVAEFDCQGRTTNGPQSIARRFESPGRDVRAIRSTAITGYACACWPRRPTGEFVCTRCRLREAGHHDCHDRACTCCFGEPDPPPPTRPSVVLDPFGGTGTTALLASVLGRHGITADLSADYCRLATWRTTDPGERARAMQVPKPPPVADGQEALFTL